MVFRAVVVSTLIARPMLYATHAIAYKLADRANLPITKFHDGKDETCHIQRTVRLNSLSWCAGERSGAFHFHRRGRGRW
jgi:hypothetical protein